MQKFAKHKGFTLIELLIVVVIIGVLAALMMMSSDEAAYSARAAAIISDMENIKAAAAAYYLDHYREIEKKDWPGFDPDTSPEDLKDKATNTLWTYLSNTETKKRIPGGKDEKGDYQVAKDGRYQYSIGGEYGSHWFVWCKVPHERVMKKLQARKATVGLVAPVKQHQTVNKDTGQLEGGWHHHSTESTDLDEYVKTLTVKNGEYTSGGYVGICIH